MFRSRTLPTIGRPLAVLGLLLLGAASHAEAQGYPPPTLPYGQGALPAPRGARLPARPRGVTPRLPAPASNQFQSFLDDVDPGTPGAEPAATAGRSRTPGASTFSPSSPFDLDEHPFLGREQLRGASASDPFGLGLDLEESPRNPAAPVGATPRNSQTRRAKYLEYLKERDPARRAQLYREYRQAISGSTTSGSAASKTALPSRSGRPALGGSRTSGLNGPLPLPGRRSTTTTSPATRTGFPRPPLGRLP
jgi:hypothetical protein